MVEGTLSSYYFTQHSQYCTHLDYSLNTYLVMIIINNYGDMKLLFVEQARSLVCVGAGHVSEECHRSDLHMIFISTIHHLLNEFTSLFCLLVRCTGHCSIYRCSAHNSKPVSDCDVPATSWPVVQWTGPCCCGTWTQARLSPTSQTLETRSKP